ncbi:MAG: proline/glycine betaine ABC transporter ATP-binding protein ProV [Rhodospirillales bacterium]|nr:MAG: proline/glycine betaine ABC transporter ATP-binding protein ProV [Rhodospirillales bacterium]
MTDKIVVNNLFKIFGPNLDEAMRLMKEEGLDKDEIYARTGSTVGVRDASFSVRAGEVFVVMGLSGSGKSTLVRMLNRLIEPTSGEILIDDHDVAKMSKRELIELRRKDLAMVFQSFALMPHRTVLENAAFGLEVAGADVDKRRDRAMQALEAVGLAANAGSYPRELSGGMKQRVGLARALATDPSIMLMDEAFSALDPLIRTEMQDELLRLQEENARTVIFISHDLDEALRIGDRIAIMEGGRIIQVDTPENIIKNPADDYVQSFFRNVDVSQVFTAADLACRGQVTVIERPGVNVRAALKLMRDHDRDLAIVIDRGGRYLGMVTAESLVAALNRRKDAEYRDVFIADVEPITADTPLTDVMKAVTASPWPVPVIDDRKRYLGTVSKTVVLQTLDRDTPDVELPPWETVPEETLSEADLKEAG